jgi:hypothetical protein
MPLSKPASTAPVAGAADGTTTSERQPMRASASSSMSGAKAAAMGMEETYSHISNELKWITVVTVITTVVLVVAYFIFR